MTINQSYLKQKITFTRQKSGASLGQGMVICNAGHYVRGQANKNDLCHHSFDKKEIANCCL